VDEKKILPFQELSKRKRKDVKAEDIKVKVHIFAFDLLYVNGEVGVRRYDKTENSAQQRKLIEAFTDSVEEGSRRSTRPAPRALPGC
jgi:DNA ligase-1